MKIIVKKNKRKGLEFQFKKIDLKEDQEKTVCQICSYGSNICTKLPDPRRSGNRDFCFMDFCMSQDKTDTDVVVPVPGSLEKLYGK